MQNIVEPRDRRYHRLKSYFAPYPEFKLKIAPELNRAFQIETGAEEATAIVQSRTFSVAPVLLTEKSPEWMEAYLLLVALKQRANSCDEKDPENCKFLPHIEKTYEQLKAEEELRNKELQARREEQAALSSGQEGNQDTPLKATWISIRNQYFPDRPDIDQFKVMWSNRKQTSSLASCSIKHNRVVVARAMKEADAQPHLEALLYHEMCHAALGEPKIVKGRRIMHGSDFKALEKKHPGIAELNAWIKSGGWHKAVDVIE